MNRNEITSYSLISTEKSSFPQHFLLFLTITPRFVCAQQTLSDVEKEALSQAVRELSNGSYDTA